MTTPEYIKEMAIDQLNEESTQLIEKLRVENQLLKEVCKERGEALSDYAELKSWSECVYFVARDCLTRTEAKLKELENI